MMKTYWRIWSNEHKRWWKPNRHGYTESRNHAGIYSFEEASQICESANAYLDDDEEPNETMLPLPYISTEQ